MEGHPPTHDHRPDPALRPILRLRGKKGLCQAPSRLGQACRQLARPVTRARPQLEDAEPPEEELSGERLLLDRPPVEGLVHNVPVQGEHLLFHFGEALGLLFRKVLVLGGVGPEVVQAKVYQGGFLDVPDIAFPKHVLAGQVDFGVGQQAPVAVADYADGAGRVVEPVEGLASLEGFPCKEWQEAGPVEGHALGEGNTGGVAGGG